MNNSMTYGELFDKLVRLGFTDQTVDLGKGTQHVFSHQKIDTATIFLPDTALNRKVESMHLTTVRAVLKANGFHLNGIE